MMAIHPQRYSLSMLLSAKKLFDDEGTYFFWKRGVNIVMPPDLVVDVHAPIRRDVDHPDIRRVHPEVMTMKSSSERNDHMRRCDEEAYATIRATFPQLTPPMRRGDGLI